MEQIFFSITYPPIPITQIGPLAFSLHGVFAALGFYFGANHALKLAEKDGADTVLFSDALTWAIFGAIIGARFFTIPAHILEPGYGFPATASFSPAPRNASLHPAPSNIPHTVRRASRNCPRSHSHAGPGGSLAPWRMIPPMPAPTHLHAFPSCAWGTPPASASALSSSSRSLQRRLSSTTSAPSHSKQKCIHVQIARHPHGQVATARRAACAGSKCNPASEWKHRSARSE